MKYEKWQYWRDPLPSPLDAKTEVFDWVRQDLGLALTDAQASVADQDRLDEARRFDLDFLPLREVNPFTQWVVKRSRDRLEQEGKLVKIEMVPHGDGQPILCSHGMEQAFELAEAFAKALHQRVKAGGFIKTLLQRRVGSSLIAGLKTTEKMLAGKPPSEDEDPDEEGTCVYPLEDSEIELLQRLCDHLESHLDREDDPKFERVREVLDLTFEGQKWIDRGVLIFSQFYDSADALAEYLFRHFDESIGLYANTSASKLFENAVKLYVFDKQLRLLVMDALERIEIALRVDIAHTLGKSDRFAYLDPALFHPEFSDKLQNNKGVTRHHEWLGKHARLINESEEFVSHNKSKYGLPLAIWVACEVWDFGTMSRLYAGMCEEEQDAISAKYGIHNGRIFAAWLRSLNYLRNVCAHHSRLWNRNIVDQPKLPSLSEVAWVAPFENEGRLRARCFLLLRIARHLLRVVNPNSSWPERMKAHLQEDFPDLDHLDLNLTGMGAPDGWDTDW